MTNRIREVRKSKHVTLEELAAQTDISTSYLSRIEKGSRGLSLENAVRIASALSCDVFDITNEFSSDDIAAAANLDLKPAPSTRGDVPNLAFHAGMGNGGQLSIDVIEGGVSAEEFTDGFWSFPDKIRSGFSQLRNIYAVPVVGDSMEPTLPGGSVAFIDTSHVIPSPADLYAIDYGDGLMIKRVELIPKSKKARVISDNERYSSYEMLRSDIQVYGRLVASFQWRG